MSQERTSTPAVELTVATPAEIAEAINRCVKAFKEVTARLPEKPGFFDSRDNHTDACRAYLLKLPVLTGPQSFQIYVACVSHGASIGAIDPIDVGRFCHVAQTAMAAWKLAHLIVPAAEAKERAAKAKEQKEAEEKARKESEKQANPLPSKGNQTEEGSKQVDVRIYPDWPKLQEYYQYLRDKGVPLIEDDYLARNPVAASLCCDVAEWALKQQDQAKAAEPDPTSKKEPAHAA